MDRIPSEPSHWHLSFMSRPENEEMMSRRNKVTLQKIKGRVVGFDRRTSLVHQSRVQEDVISNKVRKEERISSNGPEIMRAIHCH